MIKTDTENTVNNVLKAYSIYESIELAVVAWASVSAHTIFKCWSKLLCDVPVYKSLEVENSIDPETDSNATLLKLVQKLTNLIGTKQEISLSDVESWIKSSNNRVTFQILSNEDLIQYVNTDRIPEEVADFVSSTQNDSADEIGIQNQNCENSVQGENGLTMSLELQ